MVLKKSKTPKLRTGNTIRRWTRNGFILKNKTVKQESLLTISSNELDNTIQNQEQQYRYTRALQKLEHIMGWPRLTIDQICLLESTIGKDFYERDRLRYSSKPSALSGLNKNKNWTFVKTLIKVETDKEFLNDLSEDVNLKIVRHQTRPDYGPKKPLKEKIFTTSKFVAKVDKQPKNKKISKSKRKHVNSFKSRGVQRSHLFKNKIKRSVTRSTIRHDEWDLPEDRSDTVVVQLNEKHIIDSRTGQKNPDVTLNRYEYKEWNYDLFDYAHYYSEDEKKAIKYNRKHKSKHSFRGDINQECDYSSSPDFHRLADDDENDDIKTDFNFEKSSGFTFGDFVTEPRKINRKKTKKNKAPCFETNAVVKKLYTELFSKKETINSQVLFESENKEWLVTDVEVVKPSETSERAPSPVDSGYETPKDNVIALSPSIVYAERMVNKLNNSVDVVLKEEEICQLKRDRAMKIGGKTIRLGNSLPVCLSCDIIEDGKNIMTILAKEVCSKTNVWKMFADTNLELKFNSEEFYNYIFQNKGDSYSISNIINSATAFSVKLTKELKIVDKNALDDFITSSNTKYIPLDPIDAYTVLSAIENRENIDDDFNRNFPHYLSENPVTECEICFAEFNDSGSEYLSLIPCGHTFCENCWTSHALEMIHTGKTKILCMASGCKVHLSETVLSCLLPVDFINKLKNKTVDIFLQTHPECKWCPNTRCDKVVILKKSSERKIKQDLDHFGATVSCCCQETWCWNCLGEPHFPASCKQVKAFQRFSQNVSGFSLGAISTIDFEVETKQCPKCSYPIYKNEGCPHMYCGMCFVSFCWACLGMFEGNHDFFMCGKQNGEDNFYVSHDLTNKRQLKYQLLANAIQFKDKIENLKKLQSEIIKLREINSKAVEGCNILLDFLDFREKTYHFLSLFYLLYFYALENKNNGRNIKKGAIGEVVKNIEFVVWRLETKTETVSIPSVVRNQKSIRKLVKICGDQVEKLQKWIPFLQSSSASVKTDLILDIKPEDFSKYK